MSNFVSYANATSLMTAIGNKIKALNGAYIFKGSTAFASLPATLTASMTGYVYNVTDAFTTDARFVEGAGKKYGPGTNVAIANVGDATTPDMKFDVVSTFVDVDSINQAIAKVSAMITAPFDASQAYAKDDLVTKDNVLYTFTSAHTAGDPWDASEVSATTVEDLIAALVTRISGVNTRVNSVVGDLAPAFVAANDYAIDDIVTHEDVVYKFTSAHTAGDPWSASEVSAVTLSSLISAAEPSALTTTEVNTLIALLG